MGRHTVLPGLRATHVYACALLAWMLLSSQSWQAAASALSLAGVFYAGSRQMGDLSQLSFWYCLLATLALILSVPISSFAIPNPNVLGCGFVLGIAMALAYGHWWYLPIGLVGLVCTQSRGAVLASGVALLIWVYRHDKLLAIPVLLLAAMAVYLTTGSGSASIYQRFGIWQDTIRHLTPFGSGFGSFADAYLGFAFHTNMTERLAAHAYNDGLELVFELGIGAIFAWLLLITAFEADDPSLKLVLWTFLALGFTYFPLYIPILGHIFAFALGHLTASRTLT